MQRRVRNAGIVMYELSMCSLSNFQDRKIISSCMNEARSLLSIYLPDIASGNYFLAGKKRKMFSRGIIFLTRMMFSIDIVRKEGRAG